MWVVTMTAASPEEVLRRASTRIRARTVSPMRTGAIWRASRSPKWKRHVCEKGSTERQRQRLSSSENGNGRSSKPNAWAAGSEVRTASLVGKWANHLALHPSSRV